MTTDEERRQLIELLRKEHRITRAHAASIVRQEEAAKNRKLPTAEEIQAEAERYRTAEARESAEIEAAQKGGQ